MFVAVAHYTIGQTNQALPKKNSTDVAVVKLVVSVVDADGSPIEGLKENAFSIRDENVPQQVVMFSDRDEPIDCGILVDMSRSVVRGDNEKINAAVNGVVTFIELSNPGNSYFLIGFSHEVKLMVDWTKDRSAMTAGLQNLQMLHTKGSKKTLLYDALYDGFNKIGTGSNSKKVILLITDGEDNGSRHRFKEVRDVVRSTDSLLYFLALATEGSSPDWMSGLYPRYLEEISDLAQSTGGSSNHSVDRLAKHRPVPPPYSNDPLDLPPKRPITPATIRKYLSQLANQLRHQYTIAYQPSSAAEGEWRKIGVSLTLPTTDERMKTATVRHRTGYFFRRQGN